MISKSWLRDIQIFLDPSLKQKDNILFSSVTSFIEDKGYSASLELSHLNYRFTPLLIGLGDHSLKDTFNIIYKERNMSLFSEQKDPPGVMLGAFNNLDEFKIYFRYFEDKILDQIFTVEKKQLQKATKYLKASSSSSEMSNFEYTVDEIKSIDEFDREVFSIIQFEDLDNFLESYSKANKFSLFLKDPSSVTDDEEILFPIRFGSQLRFLEIKSLSMKMGLNFFASIQNVLNRIELREHKDQSFNELENLFSKLDLPIAVFDYDQNLILHNNLFIKLNLSAKKCLGFKVNEQVTIGNDVLRVQKIIDHDKKLTHINFIPVNEVLGANKSPSSEELGIVSSSIAHEINNPLAGILAALNVLELDDYSDEIEEKFGQMKQSVNRCKKLVETFLGFSKVDNRNLSSTQYGKDSFLQAMELMRFRLIENNITINFEYDEKEKLSYPVNSHVLSMIFYLFLGELLTSFSHQALVERTDKKRINLGVDENYDGIKLTFDKGISIGDALIKSRLVEHLIEDENMQITFNPGLIHFGYKEVAGKL